MATENITPVAPWQTKGKVDQFSYKSSGLLRAFSSFDAFAYKIDAITFIVAAAFSYAIGKK